MNGKVHTSDEMSSRERLLAAYRGEPTDRLPYWAKVCNSTWRTSQPREVRELSDVALLDSICADGIFGCASAVRTVSPHVEVESSVTVRM